MSSSKERELVVRMKEDRFREVAIAIGLVDFRRVAGDWPVSYWSALSELDTEQAQDFLKWLPEISWVIETSTGKDLSLLEYFQKEFGERNAEEIMMTLVSYRAATEFGDTLEGLRKFIAWAAEQPLMEKIQADEKEIRKAILIMAADILELDS